MSTATPRPRQTTPAKKAGRGRPPASERVNDTASPEQDILDVATREFAEKGFAGARVDAIAESTRTSKRMIYYHFDSKEGLYLAVLENAYRRIRRIEQALELGDLPPEQALRRLVEFTFDYHVDNPDFVRLVMNENILHGAYLANSQDIASVNRSAIDSLTAVYERGRQAGVFRKGIDPVDLHMSISALCFFTVANRHTFSLGFKRDLTSPQALAQRRASVVGMVLRDVVP
ncbi:MAG TPA: TetR family transcriptional regulator [Candidatus Aquabacterium excrementipullorum]|nr:TetR family transcriptional regulator [Candidatus Aquabacterium excrementipullorum]